MTNTLRFAQNGNEIQVYDGSLGTKIGSIALSSLGEEYFFRIHGYAPHIFGSELKQISDKVDELNTNMKKGIWFQHTKDSIEVRDGKDTIGCIVKVSGEFRYFPSLVSSYGLSSVQMSFISDKLNALNIPF